MLNLKYTIYSIFFIFVRSKMLKQINKRTKNLDFMQYKLKNEKKHPLLEDEYT